MTVNISSKHPQYSHQVLNWMLMRDSYKGERAVKAKRTNYLPATSGQIIDGMKTIEAAGYKAYEAYLIRACFPNFVREAVQTAVGMMHSKPPKIKLPKELEGIKSSRGEELPELLRRINEEQLISGRVGLLADVPTGKVDTIPYIATYTAEAIINWDDGSVEGAVPQILNFVVLDETEFERDKTSFSWTNKEKYRVLVLKDSEYQFGLFDGGTHSELTYTKPTLRGTTPKKIPFIICNSCDKVSDVDEPPLLDLGNLCMTIYRGEADYRQNLFMQGQDTLVVIGGVTDSEEAVRTGAGARIDIPMGGDAKYIGVESDGLSEQREALMNDRARAGSMGAQSLDTVSRERESGVSLNTRIAARTADLNQVALTGASALQDILRECAVWVGADPKEVTVEPNLDFGDANLSGQTMVEMQTSRNLGFPVSAKSLHNLAVVKGITKLSFEEEMEAAKQEEKTIFAKAKTGDMTPNQSPSANTPDKKIPDKKTTEPTKKK